MIYCEHMSTENKFFGSAAPETSAEERVEADDRSGVQPIDQARVRAEVLPEQPEQLDATRVLSLDEVHKISQAAQAAALKDMKEKRSREVTRVTPPAEQILDNSTDDIELALDLDDTVDARIPTEDVEPGDRTVNPLIGKVLEFQPAPKPTGDAEQDHLAKIKHIYEKTSEIYQRRLGK